MNLRQDEPKEHKSLVDCDSVIQILSELKAKCKSRTACKGCMFRGYTEGSFKCTFIVGASLNTFDTIKFTGIISIINAINNGAITVDDAMGDIDNGES